MEMDEDNIKPSSYWLDACEDISCDDLIPAEFIHSAIQEAGPSDDTLDPCFFDGILDSIPQTILEDAPLTIPSASIKAEQDTLTSLLDASTSDAATANGGGTTQPDKHHQTQLGNNKILDHNQERFGKRPRIDTFSSSCSKDRPSPSRKRPRDHQDKDSRDRNLIRRKEHHSNNARRGNRDNIDWREGRGYWERDRLGTNDMVFRPGSWEAGSNKDIKPPLDKNIDSNQGELKKDDDDSKKKMPKEHARKYQLDVLEQARNKNTIAFLETGAGKTLIAVLLIKSVCIDLHRQGKKMLAVFLVPKVPLVYQQAEVIREQTGYQVGHYCGEMGQDFWDARRWQREFEKKQLQSKID